MRAENNRVVYQEDVRHHVPQLVDLGIMSIESMEDMDSDTVEVVTDPVSCVHFVHRSLQQGLQS